MTNSILGDAFEHHIWANDRILEACEALTPNQLDAAVPGTYGPIMETIRHLIQGDSFYLWIFRDQTGELIPDENELSVAERRTGRTPRNTRRCSPSLSTRSRSSSTGATDRSSVRGSGCASPRSCTTA